MGDRLKTSKFVPHINSMRLNRVAINKSNREGVASVVKEISVNKVLKLVSDDKALFWHPSKQQPTT